MLINGCLLVSMKKVTFAAVANIYGSEKKNINQNENLKKEATC
jgi:hypothetical protein